MNTNVDIEQNVTAYMQQTGVRAREASRLIACADVSAKNRALEAIAEAILDSKQTLQEKNQLDVEAGRKSQLSPALLDRLELTASRIDSMASGIQQVAKLPDPVGEITDLKSQPSGLQIGKMRVPLVVIGIFYESRPNVTADAAAICLKAGNAAILRGGSEALHSNQAIASCIAHGLAQANLPRHAIQVVDTTDRQAVLELIQMRDYVDVIIPRGGKSLVQRISNDARVPVIKHLEGICHVYIDRDADLEKAASVAFNAKTYRYGICGAMETLLVAADVADSVLPGLSKQFSDEGVEIRGCTKTCEIVSSAIPAAESDWSTEYLAPIVSVRVVDDIDMAMAHIEEYGSRHTDAIVTENLSHARRFMREVDSSSVMVNAATCFADGFEYGLGAEIGISTDRLHVRGPVGVEGLTTQKYVVLGDGTIR